MPEYAELHQSAHKVAAASAGYTFTRAATRGRVPPRAGTVGVGDHEKAEMEGLTSTADWGSFELFARHRGKEVGIVLVERADAAQPASRRAACCPTCISVHKHKSGGESSPGSYGAGEDLSAPKCHHGEFASLQQVKKAAANQGRHFFSCYIPMWRSKKGALSRCPFFQWADQHVGGALLSSEDDRSHVDAFFQEREHTGELDVAAPLGCSADSHGTHGAQRLRVVRLTFRRGMKGRFVLISKEQLQAAEKAEGGDAGLQNDLRSAHFSFERSDGARLLFVDKRPR